MGGSPIGAAVGRTGPSAHAAAQPHGTRPGGRGVRAPGVRISKSPLFQRLFWPAVHSTLRGDLENVLIRGAAPTAALVRERPVILAPTHVAAWDALLVLLLERKLDAELYALMQRRQADALPFFCWLGALPVDEQAGAGTTLAVFRHCLRLLEQPQRLLCVFPQGRQRPPHLRPLALKGGVHLLASRSQAPVVPVSVNYLFGETFRPTAYVDLRPPLQASGSRREFLSALESSLCDGLAAIDRCHAAGGAGHGFLPQWARQPRRDGLSTRALARAAAYVQRRRAGDA